MIYSIFTEGHASATAASPVRGDLCDEAIWLAELLDETDWPAVVRLDYVMLGRQPSAIAALNRAVAISHADGPEAGLAAIDAIGRADDLKGDLATYPYLPSARGEMLLQLGRPAEAADCFRSAIDVCRNDAELAHLEARLSVALAPR